MLFSRFLLLAGFLVWGSIVGSGPNGAFETPPINQQGGPRATVQGPTVVKADAGTLEALWTADLSLFDPAGPDRPWNRGVALTDKTVVTAYCTGRCQVHDLVSFDLAAGKMRRSVQRPRRPPYAPGPYLYNQDSRSIIVYDSSEFIRYDDSLNQRHSIFLPPGMGLAPQTAYGFSQWVEALGGSCDFKRIARFELAPDAALLVGCQGGIGIVDAKGKVLLAERIDSRQSVYPSGFSMDGKRIVLERIVHYDEPPATLHRGYVLLDLRAAETRLIYFDTAPLGNVRDAHLPSSVSPNGEYLALISENKLHVYRLPAK